MFPLFISGDIWDCTENKLALHNVISSAPALDLYHDDVFYVVSRLKDDDPNGWVLAVNTSHKKLENVVPIFAERACFNHNYLICAFSNFLNAPVVTNSPTMYL